MKIIYLLIIGVFASISVASPPTIDNHIKIDQFGYRSGDKKIAVISSPVIGYNNSSPFTPGNTYQIRMWDNDAVVYTGGIVAWNGGATQAQSGDKVWWFDFSSVNTLGSYYVFDVANNVGSYQFDINDAVYLNTLKQAMRVFYYQRCGTAKVLLYAQSGWTDAACHIGNLQDSDCRLYNNNSPSTSKFLSGGWHDAGDFNKYVNFTFEPMIDMLLAYKENRLVWGDNYNIPESGNGIPDILDETKYELDWLLKMQNTNGSVLSIVGVTNHGSGSPPSADLNQRFYGPATTSATFTASAIFSLAAIQYNSIGQTSFANTLQAAAINAWNWAVGNPGITFYNSGVIGAGEQEVNAYETLVRQMAASVFLFALTGNTSYKTFFESNYTQMHLIQWSFAYPFENSEQNMMLYYSSLSGATPSIANAIKNAYTNSMKTNNPDNLPAYLNQTDAYRAHLSNQNYTWGSNTTKARQGIMFNNMLTYNLDSLNNTNYRNAALGYLNYVHGINPTAFSYLTNMGSNGAENSINKIFHAWFVNVPPPGFISGGPNPSYSLDGCCPSGCSSFNSLCNPALVTPPLNQPIQKSYKDWNTGWPQNSWTVTEPAIYTQGSYIRLLSRYLTAATSLQIKIVVQGFYDSGLNRMNRRDTVKVYMRNTTAPYTIVDSSRAVIDSLTFSGDFVFTNLPSGPYYINVKYRNSIETWSKHGGEVYNNGSPFSFNFHLDSSQTYGNNVVRADHSPVTYAIFSGDVNQDGIIDAGDLSEVDNDAFNSLSGYVRTDVTGDDFVDASDLSVVDNNAFNGVMVVRP